MDGFNNFMRKKVEPHSTFQQTQDGGQQTDFAQIVAPMRTLIPRHQVLRVNSGTQMTEHC